MEIKCPECGRVLATITVTGPFAAQVHCPYHSFSFGVSFPAPEPEVAPATSTEGAAGEQAKGA
jgi:hypothetical protein